MAENETRRVRRTPQQLAEAVDEQISKQEAVIAGYEEKKQTVIAEYDQKIEAVRSKIKKLEEKKKAILAPKPARKPRMTKKQKLEAILKQAQKSGKTPEEIAEQERLQKERIRSRERYRRLKAGENLSPPFERTCATCAKTFSALRPNAKYCCPACRQKDYRRMAREAKSKVS